MHRLLERILRKFGLSSASLPTMQLWQDLLDKIDHTYQEYDKDRILLEKSLELSSEEMAARLRQINELVDSIKLSNAKYHAMLEASPIGIFVTDESCKIDYVNPSLTHMLGVTAEDLCTKGISAFVSSQDRTRFDSDWRECDKGFTLFVNHEYQFNAMINGYTAPIWINLYAAPIISDNNTVGRICMLENTTEKHQRKMLLLKQIDILQQISLTSDIKAICESIFALIAQNLPQLSCGIYIKEKDTFNAVATKNVLTGKDSAFPVQLAVSPRITGIDERSIFPEQSKIHVRVSPVYSRDKEIIGQLLFAADKPVHATVLEQQIIDLAYNLVEFALTKKLIEDQLAIEKERVIAANKLATLGEMAGGIAHEINNPLAIIDGYANMMEILINEESSDPKMLLETIKKIRATVNRLSKMVKSFKNFARSGDTESFLEVDLEVIISETLELCADRFRLSKIDIEVQDAFNSTVVECKPVQISQVLFNLLMNSYDALQGSEEKWVKIRTKDEKDRAIVSVIDSGPGIPEAIADKIMEAYFTTKKRGKGSGLGLSICKKIIDDHRGRIYLDRTEPNTCFTFELPKRGPKNGK